MVHIANIMTKMYNKLVENFAYYVKIDIFVKYLNILIKIV